MASVIALGPLAYTTPTIWASMRLCRLRGLLAASRDAESWILHDPRAWLGSAFHKVMEAAARTTVAGADFDSIWLSAIDEAVAAASAHPLDRRFTKPERWPGYYLVRQRALSLARERAAEVLKIAGPKTGNESRAIGAERRLQTRDGRLRGRPDSFDGRTITEFKSSLPNSSWNGAEQIVDGFRRQLRLYAAIIAEVVGRWPMAGKVVAASGQSLSVHISSEECLAEAREALSALDEANDWLAARKSPSTLAQPSTEACGRCPFQPLCPAFWDWLQQDNPGPISRVAASAIIAAIDVGQDGDVYAARILILASSSQTLAKDQTLVLRRSIHGDLTGSARGAQWRIVSAGLRPDGRLQADPSTIIMAVDDVPTLVAA